MNSLSIFQIELIRADIRQNGVELIELEEDLLDHICCAMESENFQERSFEETYNKIRSEVFPEGYRKIQETTSYLLTQNLNTMKKLMNISGIGGSALLMIGSMMKALHLPLAGLLLGLGAGLIIFLFLPSLLIISLKQTDTTAGRIRNVSGYIGGTLIIIGIVSQILHWPYGNPLLLTGVMIFLLLFVPLFFKSVGRDTILKIQPATMTVILISIISSLFAFSNKRPSAAYVSGLLQVSDKIEKAYLIKNEMLDSFRDQQNELLIAGDQASNYIQELKEFIINEVDPSNPEKGLNIYNIFFIESRIDEIFLADIDQFNGRELYTTISSFVKVARKHNPQLKTILWEGEDENAWLETYFNQKPLYSIYTMLSNYQLEIVNLELELMLSKNLQNP